jgi:RNA polymerase sigma-70 factor (ECF subfamily)
VSDLGPSDESLMARVADGQAEALEALVRRHATPLLTFLCRMAGDRHRGEELFQEAFLAVWVKRRQYQCPRPFKPWLYAIALNKCRAAFRSRALVPVALGEGGAGVLDGAASPPERAIAGETAELVSRAVARLPPQQRAVVVLRVWEGMSYARIAEALGCAEATVRSHMHHALAALRRHLRPLFAAPDTRVLPDQA